MTNLVSSILTSIYSAGYTPIATCSSHNFDLVKSLGAAAAFDYKELNSESGQTSQTPRQ